MQVFATQLQWGWQTGTISVFNERTATEAAAAVAVKDRKVFRCQVLNKKSYCAFAAIINPPWHTPFFLFLVLLLLLMRMIMNFPWPFLFVNFSCHELRGHVCWPLYLRKWNDGFDIVITSGWGHYRTRMDRAMGIVGPLSLRLLFWSIVIDDWWTLLLLLLLCRNDVRAGWVGVDKLAEMEKFPIDPINQDGKSSS